MPHVGVSFANFGPYHLARLRALASELNRSGGRLTAFETAGTQGLYPWRTPRDAEPFDWVTLRPNEVLEDISRSTCVEAIWTALDRDVPDVLMTSGYARPECLAMLNWGRAEGRPVVLMSESQAIDHPRVWWKEAVKRRRVRRYASALVGGPRHRDYLESLGMPADRIAMGYNAVDGHAIAEAAERFRRSSRGRAGLPDSPYFLAVSRFAPEKNLPALVRAFAQYRATVGDERPWDLVLCGGGPGESEIAREIDQSGTAAWVHRPGFLQADELSRWYAFASAFVHPSLLEPWGLVVNEAAACGLPLLVSDRAGCVETFIPLDGVESPTGFRIDGNDIGGMAAALRRVAALTEADRLAMGGRSSAISKLWGPERFAKGAAESIGKALEARPLVKPRVLTRVG